ncbi:hypothetical protein DICVIV_10281 [Dictyocaulus viviparus]|uniref:Peptidase, S9A/B/C family, catalytic domain protein n=1 Tax=Dictyocaulus viviparus TaxID=29172 RepID=A0A0D8XIZ6_DICVI|nr:hypothetical protein DICVIV_10281 [Dictyocaulus viviparus]
MTALIDSGTFHAVEYHSDASLLQTSSSNYKYAFTTRNANQKLIIIPQEYRKFPFFVLRQSFFVGPKADGSEMILAFKWNPNPSKNDFVFVYNYNLYYQEDPESPGSARQLTFDGNYLLRYGVPDWLYEEEILSSNDALWWSESGNFLAYLRQVGFLVIYLEQEFDDRLVNRVYIPKYLRGSQYPQYMEIPYPKAGVEQNPQTKLYIWKVIDDKLTIAEPPADVIKVNESYYIFANHWIKMPVELRHTLDFERLVTIWSNREQNFIYITLCNQKNCVLTHKQSFTINGKSMWAEPNDFNSIYASKFGFFVILPHSYNDGNIYNHIAHLKISKDGSGEIIAWHGNAYDIREIKSYDMDSDILTFTSAGEGIGTMELYKVSHATQSNESSIISLSSFLTHCDYGSFDVSPNGKRATIGCSQPFRNTKMYLMNVDEPSKNKLLEDSDDLHIPFDLPELSYEVIKLPSNYEAHIGIMKPPKFNPLIKYPLLVDVYGGPNSCRVRRVTPNPNMIHYCSHLNAIVVWIDGRGASNRGWNLKSPVYKALGQFETQDTIDAVKLLISKYPFIDKERVAIFGWSYGGFLSTHIAVRDQGKTFQCVIAIAPVANFMLYDSAYSERYLGIPSKNQVAYNATQLFNKVGLLKNVNYMLAHGVADDNVHFQNSALLSEALQAELIHFTQLVYTNQDHSITTRQAHLFMEIGRFLSKECFYN